jgi:hypothetical protein
MTTPQTHDPTMKETRVGNLTRDPVLRYSAKGAAWRNSQDLWMRF